MVSFLPASPLFRKGGRFLRRTKKAFENQRLIRVPGAGVEPARSWDHRILSPVCLPITPSRHPDGTAVWLHCGNFPANASLAGKLGRSSKTFYPTKFIVFDNQYFALIYFLNFNLKKGISQVSGNSASLKGSKVFSPDFRNKMCDPEGVEDSEINNC
jgi:hypothetical protein